MSSLFRRSAQRLVISPGLKASFSEELTGIKTAGTWKPERLIEGMQSAEILVKGKKVINMCANNYLGLADNAEIIGAAKKGLDDRGFGMASVRFICGTQDRHRVLEKKIAAFHQKDDTILYSSCFDANGGLYEVILNDQDAVFTDSLNHASLIDGIRLCKAARLRYDNNDMVQLEKLLEESKGKYRRRLISSDGVFSMDGYLANVAKLCELAEKYDCFVHLDESHSTGYIGPTGRGTPEQFNCMQKVDIITSTLGKSLGGASGGYTTASSEIVELLRQRSRPYLFSNALAPPIVEAGIKVFDMLTASPKLAQKIKANTKYFREKIGQVGLDMLQGETAIVPIMLYDAAFASKFAEAMLEEGVYVIGFSYPVVPKGLARIRVQISAGHEFHHLDKAATAFAACAKKLGIPRKDGSVKRI